MPHESRSKNRQVLLANAHAECAPITSRLLVWSVSHSESQPDTDRQVGFSTVIVRQSPEILSSLVVRYPHFKRTEAGGECNPSHFSWTASAYSYRSASIGSIRNARITGGNVAAKATNSKVAKTAVSETGSWGFSSGTRNIASGLAAK